MLPDRRTSPPAGLPRGATGTVREVKFDDDDDDDFIPMPPPRRPPSPENPDDYKREPLFEPLQSRTIFRLSVHRTHLTIVF